MSWCSAGQVLPNGGAEMVGNEALGEISVLFTDIEGSTRRWEQRPQQMSSALHSHDELLRSVVSEHEGTVLSHMGDGMAIAFTDASHAVGAAIEIQQRAQNLVWPGDDRLRIRMGIHTGEALVVDGEFRGPTLNTTARVSELANGDQIVVSDRTAGLCEGFVFKDMGVHMLKGIGYEKICLVADPKLMVSDKPLRSSLPLAHTSLPISLTPLVGREVHLQEVRALVSERRLVTIKGPGGVGKTSLAISVGREVADVFSDGVAFCDLAPVDDGDGVAEALATAVGARQQPAMTLPESIESFLQDRKMVVVLDNCEHVLSSVTDLVSQLLRTGESVILATSREPLRVNGERIVEIGPLDSSTDAVELFVQRASDRDGDFDPTTEDRATIAEICKVVDGIPLAIELAAARLRVLSLPELLDRLQDRFAVLSNRKDAGRHGGLRQTIEWSHEQLDADETILFRRLSVFAGSFDLQAVEEICSDDLLERMDLLELTTALVDKSLLTRIPSAGHVRFRLLETIREFAAEQLRQFGEREAVGKSHAGYYAGLAHEMNELLLTSKEAEVWGQIDLDWGNLRRAFGDLVSCGDIDTAAQLTLDLAWYASFSMRFEALSFAEQLLEAESPGSEERSGIETHKHYVALLGIRALFAYFTADRRAGEFAAQGLAIDPSDPSGLCRGALSAVYLNNLFSKKDSDKLTSEWIEWNQREPGGHLAKQIWAEGLRAFHLGTYEGGELAQVHAANTRQIATESESPSASALASWAEGMGTIRENPAQSDRHWGEGMEAASSLGPNHLLTHLITGLRLHVMVGVVDPPIAAAACIDALKTAMDQHYLAGTSHLFGVSGICLGRAGQAEAGAKLLNTMIAHGHQPRSNARIALTMALGHDPQTYFGDAESTMSIAEAGDYAIERLAEVIAAG